MGQRHRLEKLKKERERARFPEGKELPEVESAVSVATGSSFRSFSPSVAPATSEEMSTPSREQSLLDRERSWWSADLEGGMEKLVVQGAISVAAIEPKNPNGKADHWLGR